MSSLQSLSAALSARTFIWPVGVIAITTAAGFFTMTQLERAIVDDAVAALPGQSIDNVEFVAATAGPDLRLALDRVCAVTGCDSALIGTLVISAAAGMSDTDLRNALQAQRTMLERMAVEIEAASGTSAARPLSLQWEAEARIADLYSTELNRRALVN